MFARFARRHAPDWLRPLARGVRTVLRHGFKSGYAAQLDAERTTFDDQAQVHELPPIFHYWSNRYLRPMLEEHGFSNPDQFYAKYFAAAARSAQQLGEAAKFLSIGAGNCDSEVRLAVALNAAGVRNFTLECLELSPAMLLRGQAHAQSAGVAANLLFTQSDFNRWRPSARYHAIMANQSLHHVLKLEHLFDAVRDALAPAGVFMTCDMIGRNGHMRWPETLAVVHRFWAELPKPYRTNRQLMRYEAAYKNWDCSVAGFEGIRAQDVLPELIKRFDFELFIAASAAIDVFIDRSFGPNFDATKAWDLDFIDRVHAYDEHALASGELTPTRLMAVMRVRAAPHAVSPTAHYSRNLVPERCVRDPKKAPAHV
jgi:SAM-dependent methyltransferase